MEKWKHKFELKKDRWVYIPSKEMASFGKKLHKYIRGKWRPPSYFFHMRDGGHIAAANAHIENSFFALIDIQNFFESTTQSRVTRELKKLVPYQQAREIAKLSTVRKLKIEEVKFSIPYGFPQSPILATLCLNNSHAGGVIWDIDRLSDVSISVYMDDIILSGSDLSRLSEVFESLCGALMKSRYAINSKKTQPPAKKIKVFNLELSNLELKVTSSKLVEFIMAYAKSDDEYEREGIRAYVNSVNPLQAICHFP